MSEVRLPKTNKLSCCLRRAAVPAASTVGTRKAGGSGDILPEAKVLNRPYGNARVRTLDSRRTNLTLMAQCLPGLAAPAVGEGGTPYPLSRVLSPFSPVEVRPLKGAGDHAQHGGGVHLSVSSVAGGHKLDHSWNPPLRIPSFS